MLSSASPRQEPSGTTGVTAANSTSQAESGRCNDGMERKSRLMGLKSTEIRRFERMFRVFDKDGDGAIGASELQELMRSIGHSVCKEKAVEMIKEIDGDSSGRVEFQEFLSLMLEGRRKLKSWQVVIDLLGEDPDWNRRQMQAREMVRDSLAMPSRIRPESRTRIVADFCVLLCATYFFLVVLLEDVRKAPAWYPPYKIVLEVCCTLVYMWEVWVTLNTAVSKESGGRLYKGLDRILHGYVHSPRVYVDALSLLPLDLIVPVYPADRVLRHLRLVKILRVPQLFRIENTGLMSPGYVQFYFRIVPLLVGMVNCITVLHVFAVGWMLVNGGASYSYLRAVYFVLYTLTTAGYGDVDVEDGWPMIYACCLLVLGIALNGLAIGYLTSFVMRSDIEGDKVDKMRQTLAVLRHFQVPSFLQEEILSYQYHVLDRNLGIAYTDVIAGLPFAMQQQVSLYMRVRMVSQVPMFGVCELSVQVALAQSLSNSVLPPEEYVVVAGEYGSEMFFLSHGFCDVQAPGGRHLATVAKGGFFGEVALLINTERHTNVVALTFCDLFVLERRDFVYILDTYPTFAKHIQEEIETNYSSGETAALARICDDDYVVNDPCPDPAEPPGAKRLSGSTIASPLVPTSAVGIGVVAGDATDSLFDDGHAQAPALAVPPSSVRLQTPSDLGLPPRGRLDASRGRMSRSFSNLGDSPKGDKTARLTRKASSVAVSGVFERLRTVGSTTTLPAPSPGSSTKRQPFPLRKPPPNPLEGIVAASEDDPFGDVSSPSDRPTNSINRSRSSITGRSMFRSQRGSVAGPLSPFPTYQARPMAAVGSFANLHSKDERDDVDELVSDVQQIKKMLARMMSLDTQRYHTIMSVCGPQLAVDLTDDPSETSLVHSDSRVRIKKQSSACTDSHSAMPLPSASESDLRAEPSRTPMSNGYIASPKLN